MHTCTCAHTLTCKTKNLCLFGVKISILNHRGIDCKQESLLENLLKEEKTLDLSCLIKS